MYGLARTNYFCVKCPESFLAEMDKYDVQVIKGKGEGTFAVVSLTDDGRFPSQYQFEIDTHQDLFCELAFNGHVIDPGKALEAVDRVSAEAAVRGIKLSERDLRYGCLAIASGELADIQVDFPMLVAEHVLNGQLLAYTTTGFSGSRVGVARAGVIRGGDLMQITLDLDDIYSMAESAFGSRPTPAED